MYNPTGEILRYNYNEARNTLTMWNSSRVVAETRRAQSRDYDTRITSYNVCYTKLLRHGVFGYIWTISTSGFGPSAVTTWNAYNPVSGDWVFQITKVPSGTMVYGPNGEIYIYTIDLAHGWMTMWNSTKAVQPQTSGSSGDGSWRAQGRIMDATTDGYRRNNFV